MASVSSRNPAFGLFRRGENPEARYKMAVAATFAMASVSMSQPGCRTRWTRHPGRGCDKPFEFAFSTDTGYHGFQSRRLQGEVCPCRRLFGERVEGLAPDEASGKQSTPSKSSFPFKLPARMRDLGVNKSQIPHLVDLLFTS